MGLGGFDGTVIRILHSEADATGHGRSYLLAIGNQAILDDAVLDAVCSLDLGPLLDLACVQVAGGAGGGTGPHGHQLWLLMMLGVALIALGLVTMAMATTRVLVPLRVTR